MNKTNQLLKLALKLENKYAIPNNPFQAISVEIPKRAIDVLGQWASVGRTIDTAIDLLDRMSEYVDDNNSNLLSEKMNLIDDLHTIKPALEDCHNAIHHKAFAK